MTAPSRSTSDSDLVKVVYAHDQAEAVFVQGLLRLSSPRPKTKSRWNAGLRMARPGLEPGTPRFSVVIF